MSGLRLFKWMGWGLVVWGLGLFGPEFYLRMSSLAMAELSLSLGLAMLAYYLKRYVRSSYKEIPPASPEPKHASRPSRPVPPLTMA